MKPLPCLLALLLLAACDSSGPPPPEPNPRFHPSPDAVRFVTDDVARFWAAYDRALAAGTRAEQVAAFQEDYFDRAGTGLRAFLEKRFFTAGELRDVVFARPRYFASIRPETERIDGPELTGRMRESFRALQALYPEAVFADVFFLIGRMSTGGTTSDEGLLMGAELFTVAEDTPFDELTDWHRDVVRPVTDLPLIVAHEQVHIQQQGFRVENNLLSQALLEGSADFIGELIAGGHVNGHVHAFADPIEAQLWAEFKRDLFDTDFSGWMYNAGRSGDRPADLGYYFGYKICEAFYERTADRQAAIREILNIRDAQDFLRRSGYEDKFASKSAQ